MKGSYYWRYTHFSRNHDSGRSVSQGEISRSQFSCRQTHSIPLVASLVAHGSIRNQLVSWVITIVKPFKLVYIEVT